MYRWALYRAIAKRDFKALAFHALGPGAHWTSAVLMAPVLCGICAMLLLTNNRFAWIAAVVMPAVLTASGAPLARSTAHGTRAEQELVRLSPNVPRGEVLNRWVLTGHALQLRGHAFYRGDV